MTRLAIVLVIVCCLIGAAYQLIGTAYQLTRFRPGPKDLPNLDEITVVKYFHENLDQAISDFEELVRRDPANSWAKRKLSVAYCIRSSNEEATDYEKALADINNAIRLYPISSYYSNRALLKGSRKNDLVGCLADLDEAIRIDPNNFGAYHSRSITKTMLGDKDGASKDEKESKRIIHELRL